MRVYAACEKSGKINIEKFSSIEEYYKAKEDNEKIWFYTEPCQTEKEAMVEMLKYVTELVFDGNAKIKEIKYASYLLVGNEQKRGK